ncbi:MAG TPA: hypothetical protein DCS97_11190 [Planctomycetes bacterium]|nr:hypothetical protein [Planctomycetota bacterium]
MDQRPCADPSPVFASHTVRHPPPPVSTTTAVVVPLLDGHPDMQRAVRMLLLLAERRRARTMTHNGDQL